ncbi:MAG: hypothetical protein GY822_21770 [Deltaproteobacteria bacterium]|nr:hypothetical protein [Deltaproteobacteria bacterium]
MPLPLYFFALLGLGLAAMVLCGGQKRGRLWPALLPFAGMLFPLLLPHDEVIPRGLIAFTAIILFNRCIDLAQDEQGYSISFRLLFPFTVLDLRRFQRRQKKFSRDKLLELIVYGLLAGAALYGVVFVAKSYIGWTHFAIRWSAGLVLLYAAVDAGNAFALFVCRALGWEAPSMQNKPILSKSVHEFWGRRWNREIHEWVLVHIYSPMTRRNRPILGLSLAFLYTAFLHAYPANVALGWRYAFPMGLFFLLNGAALAFERLVDSRRWPAFFGHLWTVLFVFSTSPLFMEPALSMMGMPTKVALPF